MFEAATSVDGSGRRVISLNGSVDLATSDGLVEVVRRLLADGGEQAIIVDLAGVGFLDSSGVRALLVAQRDTVAQGGSLSVCGARGIVADVLRITAVDETLGGTEVYGPL